MILGNGISPTSPRSVYSGTALSVKSPLLTLINILVFGLIFLFLFNLTASSANAATVATDTTDYPQGSTVTITGSGFTSGETVVLQVTHADGDPLSGTGHDPWNVVASPSGDISSSWFVPWDDNLNELLLLTADGQSSSLHAETTFWDKIGGNLDQFQNGTSSSTPEWANGNINGSNSCYAEGDIVPYRYFMTGVTGSTTHTFTISFEASKGGVHAIDYLAQYDLSEASKIATLTDGACSNTSTSSEPGCVTTASLSALAAMPDPTAPASYASGDPPVNMAAILSTNAPAFLIDGPGDLYGYNASSVSFSTYYYTGSVSDRELNIDVTFTAGVNGDVGFFWGGHLARGITNGWGDGTGSASVSGAPYHMRAGNIDAGGGAWQDRSIQNGVICLAPEATITCAPTADHCQGGTYSCSVPTYSGSGTPTYTWSVTGATITSGQGTETITYTITASAGQTVTIDVEACDASGGCPGDFCCNVDQVQFTVDNCCTVTITCPANTTIECDASTDPSNTGTATYSTTGSSCPSFSVTYSDSEAAGACPQEKTITRTWEVVDGSSNVYATCVQTITVEDNTAPVLVGCPANVTVECDAIPAAATVTATDNCDNSPTVTFNETTTPGACPNAYTITRTWTATDACNNSSNCTQTITVQDTQAPSLVGCPADVTVECDAIPGVATVTATDNCDNSPTVSFNETITPGACPNAYTITRTWTATDACNNSSNCSQTITVQDTQAPAITGFPANVAVQCMNEVPPVDLLSVTATDNCDPSPIVTHVSDVPDGQSCPMMIVRTYRVTDACGNFVEQAQTITVSDNVAPVLSGCPGDVTVACDAIPPMATNVTATDNCDTSPTVTPNETITAGSCAYSYTLTRTWTATDACNNSVTCTQIVTVVDNQAPVFNQACPTDVTVDCDALPTAPSLTAADNCDPNVVVQYTSNSSAAPVACPFPYTITRTWTATDVCGNTVVCTQVITVEDNDAPVLSGCPGDLNLSCTDPVPAPANVTATDNCDPNPAVTFNEVLTPGNCSYNYTLVRTWTATDACGQYSSCSQTITVSDTEAPVCSVPADQTIDLCQSEEVCLPVSCEDNCDASPTMIIIGGPGQIVNGSWCYTPAASEQVAVTVRCTDECGNSCESTFNITFEINLPPVASCPGNINIAVCDLGTPICIDGFSCSDPDGNLVSCVVSGVVNASLNGTEVCFTPVAGVNVITLTATDDCGVTDVCQTTVTVELNSAPVCEPIADISVIQCDPEEICATITVTDVDNNFDYCELVSGPGALNGLTWCWTPTTSATEQVTIRCYDDCGAFCETTFEVSVDLNEKPSITCTTDATIHWGTTFVHDFDYTDGNDGQSVTFSLGAGTPGSINSQSGLYTFSAGGQFICENAIEIIVTDDCGEADTCSFNICVQNDAPIITCSDPVIVCIGDEVIGSASASDPDNGPSALLYTIASFNGPGTVDLDPATGDFVWVTEVSAEYAGTFELCIAVSDGAATCDPCSPSNSDTCCVAITVVPAYQTIIEKRHNVFQGQIEPVSVYLEDAFPIYATGGFNLLIEYDASALSFLGALPGDLIDSCGWEYFTYRYGANGNCGLSACPSGKLRIVAIAETNNGDNHPICFTSTVTGELAKLRFLVSNDRTLECQYVPIRFCWYECSDNAFSSVTGDTLIISRYVYDYATPDPVNNLNSEFPTLTGANYSCDVAIADGKPDPLRCADFYNGGIDIVCADSIDGRGDLNLNEIAFEVADAVLFANYFVYGLSVFTQNVEGQIAASDVNADGITLSVADLVYTIRVVVGDAQPYPKVTPLAVNISNMNGVISVEEKMGAAFMIIEGNSVPTLLADQMQMLVNYDGNNTRVLIYSLTLGSGFEGEFVKIDGNLISLEMATYDGQPVLAKELPQSYILSQNYPNPFNPSTSISFNLPVAGDYTLTIYNVAGQKLIAFSGRAEAGEKTIEWNAADNQASGVYFYRLEAGSFSQTRKMILLK